MLILKYLVDNFNSFILAYNYEKTHAKTITYPNGRWYRTRK
jgi:hypothetical protein